MDFSYSPEEEIFRGKIRAWFAEHIKELPEWWNSPDVPRPPIDSKEYHQFHLWWHRKLYKAGFIGITWPRKYGGQGGTMLEEVVFHEENARSRAPNFPYIHGIGWCGPAILRFGTEEQKRRFLPRILSAEDIWCTFYSEPDAGSDMANVQTRALEKGDCFVVNGQKVWSSDAHLANWGVLLARTNPDAPKHHGLSFLLVDMSTPGITLRPLRNLTGTSEFNEAYFDNVVIPKHQLLGEKDMGWKVVTGAMEFERFNSSFVVDCDNILNDLIKMTINLGYQNDPIIRQSLAQLHIECNVFKYMNLRNLTYQLREGKPGAQSTMASLFYMELLQRLYEFAMQLQGPYCRLINGSKYAIQQGIWQYNFLFSRGFTLATGTSEIKRNVIAQAVLGLPR